MMNSRVLVAGLALGGLLSTLPGCGGGAAADTPDAAVQQVFDGLAQNDPSAAWEMLPPSYQQDVNDLVSEFASKVDAELYNTGMGAAQKLVTVLSDQKEYVLGFPALSGMATMLPGGQQMLNESYDDIVAVVDTLVSSEISTHDKLAKLDVGAVLGNTGKKLMSQFARIAENAEAAEYPDFGAASVAQVSMEGETARLRISMPGEEPEEVAFAKVEGHWIPADMAAEWSGQIAAAKEQLAAMTPQSPDEVAGTLAQVKQFDAVLAEALAAGSQEEFNQAVGKLMGGMSGMSGMGEGR